MSLSTLHRHKFTLKFVSALVEPVNATVFSATVTRDYCRWLCKVGTREFKSGWHLPFRYR